MRKHWVWWAAGVAVLVLVFYPKELMVVPAYRVTLKDQFGKPLVHAGVSELWQQTSAERQENLAQAFTNAQGVVEFPERAIRASLARRMVGCFAYLAREGLAATCGNRWSITAAGDYKELDRTETVTGIFRKEHSLVLTLKQCDLNEPGVC
ncbi:MAG: hypothetical protein QJR10_00530 [Bacillota bacterium]|nr:hypothetical protein [Bacillota bacterium]